MRPTLRLGFVLALLLVRTVTGAGAERPTHDGKVVLFGNTHAHSLLSDDVKERGAAIQPANGFAFAQAHGLDFLAISDHHKADDSPGPYRMTPTEYKTKLFDVAMDYNAAHAGEFIAIPAFEWGNTATGNHVNVFGSPTLPPDSIKDADYDELYTWAAAQAKFIQFNHPNSWKGKRNRNKNVGNFGEALYSPPDQFVSQVNPSVKAIAIICTVAGGHINGQYSESTEKTHREMQWENYYKQYLNMRFHLAPSADQDTHRSNWGVVTAARTAVWADSPSYDDLMAGFRACRTYATEDDEMAVVFQVRHHGKAYWMGESVPLDQEESDVDILVKIWQSQRNDPDLSEEGPYTVDIVSDADGVGGRRAAIWETIEDIPSGALRTITVPVAAGEYLYLRVTEQAGKDNPIGDGEDEFNTETGADDADGKRDDLNDSAWTAPIWFVGPSAQATYVWSRRSSVYHDPDCWAVKLIGEANRETGPAPAGKRKHNCHP